MYMVVHRDLLSGKPRIRFYGKMNLELSDTSLSQPLIITPPKRDYSVFFMTGSLEITKVKVLPVPSQLIKDDDIQFGRLANLYKRGLIGSFIGVENSGYIDINYFTSETGFPSIGASPDEIKKLKEEKIGSENIYSVHALHVHKALYGWNGHGFGGSTVSHRSEIYIPLNVTPGIYTDLKMNQSLAVCTGAVMVYNGDIKGYYGLSFLSGMFSGTTGAIIQRMVTKGVIQRAIAWGLAKVGKTVSLSTIESIVGTASLLGKAMIIVGIGLIADSIYEVWAEEATLQSVRTLVSTVPIIQDEYGNCYAVVQLFIPEEERTHIKEYEEHFKNMLTQPYIDSIQRPVCLDVLVIPITFGKTWEEYYSLIRKGFFPAIDLKYLATFLALMKNINPDKMKIVGVDIIVETLTHGWTGLWQYLSGGTKVLVSTIIIGKRINVQGILFERTYTDPREIVSILGGKVTINGKEYSLIPGLNKAYASFANILGADKIVIDFGDKEGFFADMRLVFDVYVTKLLEDMGSGVGMKTSIHYNWDLTEIKLYRIEILDLPYKAIKIERTVKYREYEETNDITTLFKETSVSTDLSPTGVFYYYTTYDTVKFDPANGGTMQPCKYYEVRVFFKNPPNVWIRVFLNGTRVTSTLPRHATIVIHSLNAEQKVIFQVDYYVKYYEGFTEVVDIHDMETIETWLDVNETEYWVRNIALYVDRAIELMKSLNKTAFVEIEARIIYSEYNFVEEDDYDKVIYYPPPLIVQEYGKPCNLTIEVLDAFTLNPLANVSLVVYNKTTTLTGVTDSNGRAVFRVTTGLWYINASLNDYIPEHDVVYVYGDMLRRLYLMPETAIEVIEPPINSTEHPIIYNNVTYWWLSVQVTWKDGFPFTGANITITDLDTGTSRSQLTNGTGFAHFIVKNGTRLNITVYAEHPENPSLNYTKTFNITMTQHYWFVVTLPWTSKYFEPEVMVRNVDIIIHRGRAKLPHLILGYIWTNVPQTVTIDIGVMNATGYILSLIHI